MDSPLTISGNLVRAAQANQAKNDVRYYLNAILLTADGNIVSTDGHTLFKAPYIRTDQAAVAEDILINIDGTIPLAADSVTFQFDTKMCRTNKGKLFEFKVVDGKFPQWERVIPKAGRKGNGISRIDSTYLARAEKTFGKREPVDIEFGESENDSLLMTSPSMPGGILVVMPMRK